MAVCSEDYTIDQFRNELARFSLLALLPLSVLSFKNEIIWALLELHLLLFAQQISCRAVCDLRGGGTGLWLRCMTLSAQGSRSSHLGVTLRGNLRINQGRCATSTMYGRVERSVAKQQRHETALMTVRSRLLIWIPLNLMCQPISIVYDADHETSFRPSSPTSQSNNEMKFYQSTEAYAPHSRGGVGSAHLPGSSPCFPLSI